MLNDTRTSFAGHNPHDCGLHQRAGAPRHSAHALSAGVVTAQKPSGYPTPHRWLPSANLSTGNAAIALICAHLPPTHDFSPTFPSWLQTRPLLLTFPSFDSLRARVSTHELSHASTMARLVASAAAAAVVAATLFAATPSLVAIPGGDNLVFSVHKVIVNVQVLTLAAGCGAACQAEVSTRLAAAGCDHNRPFPRLRKAAAHCAGADVLHASGLNDTKHVDASSGGARIGATLNAIPGVLSVDKSTFTKVRLRGANEIFTPRGLNVSHMCTRVTNIGTQTLHQRRRTSEPFSYELK